MPGLPLPPTPTSAKVECALPFLDLTSEAESLRCQTPTSTAHVRLWAWERPRRNSALASGSVKVQRHLRLGCFMHTPADPSELAPCRPPRALAQSLPPCTCAHDADRGLPSASPARLQRLPLLPPRFLSVHFASQPNPNLAPPLTCSAASGCAVPPCASPGPAPHPGVPGPSGTRGLRWPRSRCPATSVLPPACAAPQKPADAQP